MQQQTFETPLAEAITRATGTWDLVADASMIEFYVKKFWGLVTVAGTFADATGEVHVAPDGAISAVLDIDAASVDTGQAKRDEHLRSADFFDVARSPRMRVDIDRIEQLTPRGGTAVGRLTIRGETQPVRFDVVVSLSADADVAEVSAELAIDRSDFGIDWSPLRMASMEVGVATRLRFRKV